MYQPPLRFPGPGAPLGYGPAPPYPAVNGYPAHPYGAPPPPIGFVYPDAGEPVIDLPANNPVPADYPPQIPDQQIPEYPLFPEGSVSEIAEPESPEDIPDIKINPTLEMPQVAPLYTCMPAPQPVPENISIVQGQPQPSAQNYAPLYHKNMPVSFEHNPAVMKLRQDKFRAQLGKWIMVHHIPIWAEKQLMVHMQQELARKERMKKYTELSCGNVFRPWRWCRMWRARHVRCKGDIKFPSRDDIPKSQMLHEVEDPIEQEVQLTEDLINEIMEEETPESAEVIFYEKNGLQGISEWTPLSALLERNKFFTKTMVRENRIRSFALAHPKPTDLLPGDSRLNTDERLNYAAGNKMTTFDSKRILHVQEVQMLDHQPNSTDPIKKQKKRRSRREKKRKKQASIL